MRDSGRWAHGRKGDVRKCGKGGRTNTQEREREIERDRI